MATRGVGAAGAHAACHRSARLGRFARAGVARESARGAVRALTSRSAATLAIAVAVALVSAGCSTTPRATPVDLAQWRAGAAAIDSLTALDSIDEALSLAHDRDARARSSGGPAWMLAESRDAVRALDHRAALPEASRLALARADHELMRAHRNARVDSLGGAVELCRAVLGTRDRLLGSHDVRTAIAALELAVAEAALAHAREADSLARAARTTFASHLGSDHPYVAEAEELLGRVVKDFTGSDGYEEALAHYRTALAIRVANEGERSLAVAATRQDLGNLYRTTRRSAEAYREFRAAYDICRAQLGPVHDRTASTLGSMAFLRAGEGYWADAESLAQLAIDATPPGSGSTAGARSMRLGLRGTALRHLDRNAEAVAVLSEAIAVRESIWARTPRDEGSSITGGLALYRDLALALAAEGRGEEAFEQMERGSARALIHRLLGSDPANGDLWHGLVPRVQRSLGPDEALVAWPRTATTMFVGDYPLYACVLRSRGPVQWVRLDRRTKPFQGYGTIREAMLWELRAASNWPRRVPDTATMRDLERQSWAEWFQPLEPALRDVKRIVVCSPYFVYGGPLGMLRDDQGRYLSDRFAMVYTPSALLFARERERPMRRDALWPGPALIVGNPTYAAADSNRWANLASAEEEIRGLSARLPTSTTLLGDSACASRLRDLAASGELARFRLLHFAAHTLIDGRRVLESALILAPDSAGAPSSRISARDVIDGWRLTADVVSLAACRSSVGMSSATEGSMGLQQAFLAAGARSLLVTLWPVDDRATARLMNEFYARFADHDHPMGAADALREAQAALREWRSPDGQHPYAHPAYWAAFLLVGDPG